MAIASRSLFPYLTLVQVLPDEAEFKSATSAQPTLRDGDYVPIIQRYNDEYTHAIQQVAWPNGDPDLWDEQQNGLHTCRKQCLVGRRDCDRGRGWHAGRAS